MILKYYFILKLRILQETVHDECLERQELHEKLNEARDELLELKKNACKFYLNISSTKKGLN